MGYAHGPTYRRASVKMDLMATENFDRGEEDTSSAINAPPEFQPQSENDNKFQKAIAVWRGMQHHSSQFIPDSKCLLQALISRTRCPSLMPQQKR